MAADSAGVVGVGGHLGSRRSAGAATGAVLLVAQLESLVAVGHAAACAGAAGPPPCC